MELLSIVTAAFVAVLIGAEVRDDARLRWVAKPLASLAFVALAVVGGVGEHPGWGPPMLAGFVLCMLGDVLLIPADKRVFLAGIGAFLLGHVGFAAAFLLRGVQWGPAAVAAALLIVPVAVVVRWLSPHLKGPMKGAVPAYIVVICAMVSLSVGTAGVQAAGRGAWLVAGAMAFWVSDLCVARQRFVVEDWRNRMVGLPLYYGAMVVLAWAASTRS
jgi:uncharacterized membrane protein YhhN